MSKKHTEMCLIGHPVDGSAPFIMAVLDLGNDPQKRAREIWDQTHRLYTQALLYYTVEEREIGS